MEKRVENNVTIPKKLFSTIKDHKEIFAAILALIVWASLSFFFANVVFRSLNDEEFAFAEKIAENEYLNLGITEIPEGYSEKGYVTDFSVKREATQIKVISNSGTVSGSVTLKIYGENKVYERNEGKVEVIVNSVAAAFLCVFVVSVVLLIIFFAINSF